MTCPRCGGTGYVEVLCDMGDGTPGYSWQEWVGTECPDCHGTGQVDEDETR